MSSNHQHTLGQAITFIEACFGPAKLTNGGLNANVACPVCASKHADNSGKRKLAIRTDNWLTHCWRCGYKARSIYHLLSSYKPILAPEWVTTFNTSSLIGNSPEGAVIFDPGACPELPVGFQLLAPIAEEDSTRQPRHIHDALRYLKGRGIGTRELWYFKIGVTNVDPDYKGRIIVPSHDADGKLNFFVGRSYNKYIKPHYLNPTIHRTKLIFNELNIDWSEELTIVEGVFDLMKVDDNATCLLGKQITSSCALFEKIVLNNTPVVICLDSDAPKENLEAAKLLYDYGVDVRMVNLPRPYKDPGEMSREQFATVAKTNSREFDDIYYLKSIIDAV